MGRFYSVAFADVAVVAVQDLINLTATANMAFRLHRVELGQRTLTAWEAKPIKIIRNLSVVTAGSGGAAATPQKANNGDAAATVTARTNDTTAQTGTTTSLLFARNWEFLNGFFELFTPREDFIIAPSQGLSINLSVAPSASMTVSGSVVIEELF